MKLSTYLSDNHLKLSWWKVRHPGDLFVWYGSIDVDEPDWKGVVGIVSHICKNKDDDAKEARMALLSLLAGQRLDGRKGSGVVHIIPADPRRMYGTQEFKWFNFPSDLEIDTLGEDKTSNSQL